MTVLLWIKRSFMVNLISCYFYNFRILLHRWIYRKYDHIDFLMLTPRTIWWMGNKSKQFVLLYNYPSSPLFFSLYSISSLIFAFQILDFPLNAFHFFALTSLTKSSLALLICLAHRVLWIGLHIALLEIASILKMNYE